MPDKFGAFSLVRNKQLFLLLIAALSGCATAPVHYWDMSHYQITPPNASQVALLDQGSRRILHTIPAQPLRLMQDAHAAIERISGQSSRLILSDEREVNAGAGVIPPVGPAIIVNLPMVQALGADRDEWAALLGHETAHLVHHDQEKTKNREEIVTSLGAIVRLFIAARTGVDPGDVPTTAFRLVSYVYSRDQERQADLAALPWMCEAGYDPRGAVRLQETLVRIAGNNTLSFLSEHPSGTERIQYLRQEAEKGCLKRPGFDEFFKLPLPRGIPPG